MTDISHVKLIAPKLQQLQVDPHAKMFYELFSSALVWSDEFPMLDDIDEISCLRRILWYRTTIIIGQPEVQYQPYWLAALELSPAWPGFLFERRASSWASTYYDLAKDGNARVDAFFDAHPD